VVVLAMMSESLAVGVVPSVGDAIPTIGAARGACQGEGKLRIGSLSPR
jgi:hypothetical protein